jgi:hypothetical protein
MQDIENWLCCPHASEAEKNEIKGKSSYRKSEIKRGTISGFESFISKGHQSQSPLNLLMQVTTESCVDEGRIRQVLLLSHLARTWHYTSVLSSARENHDQQIIKARQHTHILQENPKKTLRRAC